MIQPGTLLLHDTRTPDAENLLFAAPHEILFAHTPAEARAALARIAAAQAAGHWVAGYFAYELGYLFEERLEDFLPARSETPLLWLGLYAPPVRLDTAAAASFVSDHSDGPTSVSDLSYGLDFPSYTTAFDRIKTYIEAGDVYQVNLTFKAGFRLGGDPVALYRDLAQKQPVAYGALLHTGDHTILSRSPELFVQSRDGVLSARPMKGTMARGRTLAEDEAGRMALRADEKSRAENLMIVDLLRNDLGRIADIGSVHVTDLFTVETYRSLHQMTSGITARQKPGLGPLDILRHLFPCGSITGAPKIRAMEIIHELEAAPRGVYTGALGYFAPGGDFVLNVAIRTAIVDRAGRGEIGIGGGIVADSDVRAEYDEALLKLKFLTDPAEPVALIETLLWEAGTGFTLLPRHLARLAESARYFAIPLAETNVVAALGAAASGFTAPRMRVRLLLHEHDGLSVTAAELPLAAAKAFRFRIADERQDSENPLLYHKTTRRAFHDEPRKRAAERFAVDEVVFLNERGELTEGSITSLFVERDGVLLTPALGCGLLPGTLRAELLATGRAREAILTPDDLRHADAVFLGNGVRGLMSAVWDDTDPQKPPG